MQNRNKVSLLPEVVVEAVPRGELAALVDQHGGGGGAVPGQLLVSRIRRYLPGSNEVPVVSIYTILPAPQKVLGPYLGQVLFILKTFF